MTPADMAALHSACFTVPRPWSAGEFKTLLADPQVILLAQPDALVAVRVIGPEAEVLTICTDPAARGQGLARALLARAEEAAKAAGAETVFLEVAEDNDPARRLYQGAEYRSVGRRKDYYRGPRGERVTADILRKPLIEVA